MSMISSQCDDLRKVADELQGLEGNIHNYTWSGFFDVVRHAQQGLRSAADTIWELRCKLAGVVDQSDEMDRLKAENTKLRRELDFYKAQVEPVEEERIRFRERWKEALAENAKLRDAMYTNAGKHALQHMDEDELRIWATQQSEYIEELLELLRDLWRFTGTACKKYPKLFDPSARGGQMVQLNQIDSFEQRMRELGVLDE